MISKILLLYVSITLFGCQSRSEMKVNISEIELLTKHSGEPNLTVNQDGYTYLSWVEYENDSMDVLKFSMLENESWTKPKVISQGTDWFVNWADFPSLVSIDRNNLSAHWLQKSTGGTYDYDVHISKSADGGETWSPSIIPHRDEINAEHGFVSMLATPDDKTLVFWLDGRNTKKIEDNAMTLRTAIIEKNGNITEEVALDRRVCDCCQTGATWTSKGPIVVYRDRSKNEIRDIGIVRKVNDTWTPPSRLFEDNWMITGCPVNGPSIASQSNMVVVGWFTMPEDKPKVLIATSLDFGETFSTPIQIDQGNAIGRVDVVIDGNQVIATWMENEIESAAIKMRSIDFDGKVSEVYPIGSNSNSRESGFPRLIKNDAGLLMAWTDALDSISTVRTFKISLDHE